MVSRQYKTKADIYARFNNLIFVTPSKWLLECARSSGLMANKRIYHIPYVLSPIFFNPMDKALSKKLFSIKNHKKIIGFGAEGALINPYKGWNYLKDALIKLSNDNSLEDMQVEIVIFGSNYNKKIADEIHFKTHFLGKLYDEYSLVMAYNAMDVFVIPSLADNFPQVIIESLAADVPVVGFNVGGIPDTINSDTGYLAEYKNSSDLAKGLSLILKGKKKHVNNYAKHYSADIILAKHEEMWNNANFK
jgi:glycosyltransferase involved in cell wall biosynthesis